MRFWRAWINQPSELQPFHSMHGTNCLVLDDEEGDLVHIGFIGFSEGLISTMLVPRIVLSKGIAQQNYG